MPRSATSNPSDTLLELLFGPHDPPPVWVVDEHTMSGQVLIKIQGLSARWVPRRLLARIMLLEGIEVHDLRDA